MAEYIYLTTEERKRFVSNRLEYLTTELQTNLAPSLTNSTLKPVYKIAPIQKIITTINNREIIPSHRQKR